MARSMKWPPEVGDDGRTVEVTGVDAVMQLARMSVNDLGACPTMPRDVFIRDQSWISPADRARAVANVLQRLRSMARDIKVSQVSGTTTRVTITFDDDSATGVM